MAQIESLIITAARKVSANYNTRDVGFTVTVTPGPADDPRVLTQRWTRALQDLCDQELGDVDSPASFAHSRSAA